jgi:diguanylate cyclase (GGDEF)-like protein/PAS domain S-box-containing protein
MRVLTVLSVLAIFFSIVLNTVLATEQTKEQNRALVALQTSNAVKRSLDGIQQALFDEHAEIYTRAGTAEMYRRDPYAFPIPRITGLVSAARAGCALRANCIPHLDELQIMIRALAAQSESIAQRTSVHPGRQQLNDPGFVGLDAYFYSVIEKVIEIRIETDADVDVTVSKTSLDAQRISDILFGSALAAGLILIALLFRAARSDHRLRLAWSVANSARAALFTSKQTLEYVLDHVSQGIAWKNTEHRYCGGNEIYARDAGLVSRESLVGKSDSDLLWGDDASAAQAEDLQVMAGLLHKRNHEREVFAVDGSKQWIAETKLPLRDQSGAVTGVLTAYENITARRQAELALRLQSRALDASMNAIIITEPRSGTHVVLYVNAAFERITGYGRSEVIGVECNGLFGLAGEEKKWWPVREALDKKIEANVTLNCIRKNGEKFWSNILVAPVRDTDGNVTHSVGVMCDVTEVIRYQGELRHQARFDVLTGLPNRAALDEYLTQGLVEARESNGEIYVLFLDLDRFKEVNDSLGHRMGDALLSQVSDRLRRVVGSTGFVARYGGDEFMIVVERAESERLESMLDALVLSMSEPLSVAGRELFVEVSVGISIYPQDGMDADTLIRNADAAMYFAKESGRNGYKYYRPELNQSVAERLVLSTRLRQSMLSGGLSIHYQPQLDMVSGTLCGVEALLRWRDAQLGDVSPAVFIPIAEENGLISKLGEWVLKGACMQMRAWLDAGVQCGQMSVNVSPTQLERSDLVETVRQSLALARIPGSMLELEVTEGALMRNPDDVARTLTELRGLGVKIAIDDFGTGYSSLSYLKRFSIDRIKIDRAFVHEIGRDAGYEALTLAIIGMANALGFDVVAEGVETNAQRCFLLNHGCIRGQGFLFSPAIPDVRFREMFAEVSGLHALA